MKLLGNVKKGIIFVISAPAGTGKTTLVKMLEEEFDCIEKSVTYTTRKIRKNEEHSKDYFFITENEFKEKIRQDSFLEYAKVFDNYYGTCKETVFNSLSSGKHVILVIDTQGAKSLIEKNIPAVLIFISPPSFDELGSRLKGRETESHESIEKRLHWAKYEVENISLYDYHIINDDLVLAYTVLRSILIAEEHKVSTKQVERW